MASPINRTTLAVQVYQQLKNLMTTNEILPGTRLNEVDLAERFNVSATPVREAINKLRGDGLVQYHGGWQGATVIQLTIKDIEHIYDIRYTLECLALQEAFPSIKQTDLENLKNHLLKFVNRENFNEKDEANVNFHGFFLEKSKNPFLQKMMNDIK